MTRRLAEVDRNLFKVTIFNSMLQFLRIILFNILFYTAKRKPQKSCGWMGIITYVQNVCSYYVSVSSLFWRPNKQFCLVAVFTFYGFTTRNQSVQKSLLCLRLFVVKQNTTRHVRSKLESLIFSTIFQSLWWLPFPVVDNKLVEIDQVRRLRVILTLVRRVKKTTQDVWIGRSEILFNETFADRPKSIVPRVSE